MVFPFSFKRYIMLLRGKFVAARVDKLSLATQCNVKRKTSFGARTSWRQPRASTKEEAQTKWKSSSCLFLQSSHCWVLSYFIHKTLGHVLAHLPPGTLLVAVELLVNLGRAVASFETATSTGHTRWSHGCHVHLSRCAVCVHMRVNGWCYPTVESLCLNRKSNKRAGITRITTEPFSVIVGWYPLAMLDFVLHSSCVCKGRYIPLETLGNNWVPMLLL